MQRAHSDISWRLLKETAYMKLIILHVLFIALVIKEVGLIPAGYLFSFSFFFLFI